MDVGIGFFFFVCVCVCVDGFGGVTLLLRCLTREQATLLTCRPVSRCFVNLDNRLRSTEGEFEDEISRDGG